MRKLIIALLVIAGLATLAVGIYFPIQAISVPLSIRLIFSGLMVLDAIAYFVVSWGIYKEIKWLFYPTVVLLAINILALAFDNIGWADFVFGFYNLILILLIFWRKYGQRTYAQ